jgi:hypothetical protein
MPIMKNVPHCNRIFFGLEKVVLGADAVETAGISYENSTWMTCQGHI